MKPDITEDEIKESLTYMKNNKVFGHGSAPTELIKNSPSAFLEELVTIFSKCFKGNKIPDDWKSSIHKNGSKLLCDNCLK